VPTVQQYSKLKYVFFDDNSFATTLLCAFVDMYGTEAFALSPETIRAKLAEDLREPIPDILFDRLMMGIHVVTSNAPFKMAPDFIETCLVLSGAPFTPYVFQPADADDCAWGIIEMLLLSPPDDDDEAPFSPEITGYIAEIMKMEGILNPPDVLRIADPSHALDQVHADWSDDPEMASGIWEMESSKTDDINNLVKERLTLLVTQLDGLQLTHGDTSDAARRMLNGLKNKPKGGSPL